MIKAAINGVRPHTYHPRLPFDADTAAKESARCVAAGAGAIHVHVWNAQNQESLAADDVANFLNAIRAACPGIPVGISSGEWIVPDLAERLKHIQAWDVVPDFVSLNTDEADFEKVAGVLLSKNIGIEAGIFNKTAVQAFAAWEKRDRCLRILIEPNETTVKAAINNVIQIETILKDTAPQLPRLLHGLDETTWPMVKLAAERGYDTRIGFEDSAYLPDGQMAEFNDELVRAAAKIMSN